MGLIGRAGAPDLSGAGRGSCSRGARVGLGWVDLRSWSAQLEQLLVFNFRLMIVVRSCCRLATLLGWEYLLCYGRLWYFKIPEWTKTSAGEKLIAAI